MLFAYENMPGTCYVSGSQDAIDIVYRGINCLWYDKGEYWPSKITSVEDMEIQEWLEKRIFLVQLSPRSKGLDILDQNLVDKEKGPTAK